MTVTLGEAPTVIAAATGAEPAQSILAPTVTASDSVNVASDMAVPLVDPVSGAVQTGTDQRASIDPEGTPKAKASKVRAIAAALEKANSSGIAPVADFAVDRSASFKATAEAPAGTAPAAGVAASAYLEPRREPETTEESVVAAMENSIGSEAKVSVSLTEDLCSR